MKTLSSNSELYKYLLELEGTLRRHEATDLADAVGAASHQAASSSTEFLGESRIALRRVSNLSPAFLKGQELTDLADVLKQLDVALDRR
jgi:hypothetical protein